jgi:hypothetical protein
MIPDKSLTIVVSYPTKASCYQFVTPAAGAAANARRSRMRKIMIVAAAAAIASLTGAAIANEELRASRDVPQEQRISPDEMKANLDKLGYDVRRLEQDDGRFQAHLIERQSGGAVKATFKARTGELIRAKLHS